MVSIAPLTLEFYEQAARWLADPEINRFLYSEWRKAEIDERLVALVSSNKKNQMFLIREGNRAVGIVSFGEINAFDASASIWYLLGVRNSGRRGVATEAVGQAVAYGWAELRLQSIYASIIDGNEPSRRVLEKNGFSLVGRFRRGFRVGDTFRDRVVFDKIRDDHPTR